MKLGNTINSICSTQYKIQQNKKKHIGDYLFDNKLLNAMQHCTIKPLSFLLDLQAGRIIVTIEVRG